MNATTYDVTVTRDGRWWLIEFPAIPDAAGQVRRLTDVEDEAGDIIAIWLDVPRSSVSIGEIHVIAGEVDVTAVRGEVADLRHRAAEAEARAFAATREHARELIAAGVSTRDVGEVLGISHQRVAQLVG